MTTRPRFHVVTVSGFRMPQYGGGGGRHSAKSQPGLTATVLDRAFASREVRSFQSERMRFSPQWARVLRSAERQAEAIRRAEALAAELNASNP